MESMKPFAHLTSIIYRNLGRPQKSLLFPELRLFNSGTMMHNNIHHCDSDTAANSSSASERSESRLSGSWDVIPPLRNVSIGASFHTLIEEQKNIFNSLLTNFLISIVCNIEHCQWTLAGERMSYKLQRRWVWPQRTTLVSRPLQLIFKKLFGQHTKIFQRVGVNGGFIKEVCVRWFLMKLQCRFVWILSHTGRQCYWE